MPTTEKSIYYIIWIFLGYAQINIQKELEDFNLAVFGKQKMISQNSDFVQLAFSNYLSINRNPKVFLPLSPQWIITYTIGDHWFSLYWFTYAFLVRKIGRKCLTCPWNLHSLPPGGNSELYLELQIFCSEMSLEHHPSDDVMGFCIWSWPRQNLSITWKDLQKVYSQGLRCHICVK